MTDAMHVHCIIDGSEAGMHDGSPPDTTLDKFADMAAAASQDFSGDPSRSILFGCSAAVLKRVVEAARAGAESLRTTSLLNRDKSEDN